MGNGSFTHHPQIPFFVGRAFMRCRDHVALTLPSLLLRLVLGITFLWAGAGKIIGTTTVEGDNAARLANLGGPFIQETVDEAID